MSICVCAFSFIFSFFKGACAHSNYVVDGCILLVCVYVCRVGITGWYFVCVCTCVCEGWHTLVIMMIIPIGNKENLIYTSDYP